VRGVRRYQGRETCPECHRQMETLVPWHGDGSVALIVTHGPRGARCPGSRGLSSEQETERERWGR
jgi:hypothetical protein